MPAGACPGVKLLIDGCLTPLLALVAHAFGYVAYPIHDHGWGELKDYQLLPRLLDEDLTIVTNNRSDWRDLLGNVELHPGLIVIQQNAPRATEIEHFTRVMLGIAKLPNLINTAVEVAPTGVVRAYDLPQQRG